jgi:aqualysin 1
MTLVNGNEADTFFIGTVGGSIYGVAKKTTLVAVKVLNCGGSGAWTGVVSGVEWAVNDRRARGGPRAAAK